MRSPNHNFSFTECSLPVDSNGEYTIYILYKFGKTKKVKSTPVKIPAKSWDKNNNWIRSSHEKDLDEQRLKLNALKDKFKYVRYKMSEGKMTIDSAFNHILDKVNNERLQDFAKKLKPTLKTSESTLVKHRDNLSALESHFKRLGHKDLTQLTFVHLNSLETVKRIHAVVTTEIDIKNNTQASYLKTLDRLTVLNASPMQRPFAANKLLPSEKAPEARVVFYQDMMEGLNMVNTTHQFSGFLWWLYSFCLMGMDGIDMASISEKNLAEDIPQDFDVEDYFPTAGMKYKDHFNKRLHLQMSRGKSDVDFVIMVNLFPTLMIRDLLHRLIKANWPQYAYEGEDRLRLFNFDIYDKNGAVNPKSFSKWNAIRKSWSTAQNKCFGFTTQSARHTVTRQGQDLGASKILLNAQLGHAEKSVMRHYLSEDQIELDLLQTHIIQEFGVLDILKVIYEDFVDRFELLDNKEIPFITKEELTQTIDATDEFKEVFKNKHDSKVDFDKFPQGVSTTIFSSGNITTADVELRETTIKSGLLTPFSRADEWEFERLKRKESERNWVKVDGKRVQALPEFNQLSHKLQGLIKKRFETVGGTEDTLANMYL